MSFLSLPPGAAARPSIVGIGPPTDLRPVLPSSLFRDFMQAFTASGPFVWDSASVLPDDGVTVIIPNDIIFPAPGRWLKTGSASGAGVIDFTLSGQYSGAVVPGFFDPPVIVQVGFTIDHVFLVRRTAGTGSRTQVDVTKNGVSIFNAPGDQPRVNATDGDYASAIGNVFAPGANVFVPGDILEVSLEKVEGFKGGPPAGPEGVRVTIVKA